MSADPALSPLQGAVALSAQMRECAGQGEWDRVTALHALCDAQLRQATLVAADMAALRELREDQQAVLELAARARDTVGEAMARHRTSHRALSAYISSADGLSASQG